MNMEALNLDQEFWKDKLCLKVKKLKDDSMYIEGYANMATLDRVREIIGPKAWKLESFNKAGVILFNHDQHKPIGKPVKVEVRSDGLYIKARISGSNDPEITKIRDLIEEGILNQFSVGFKTRDSKRLNDGSVEITDAELFEVSVVSVPANADSLFIMSKKYLKNETCNEIITEYLTMKHAGAALRFREELKKKNILISSAQDILTREASIPADIVEGLTSGDMEWKQEFFDLVNKTFGINVKAVQDNVPADDPAAPGDPAASEAADSNPPPADGSSELSVEEMQAVRAAYEADRDAVLEQGEEYVPDWVTDPELWKSCVELSIAALGEVKFSFALYCYHLRSTSSSDTQAKHITIKSLAKLKLITIKDAMAVPMAAPPAESSVPVKPMAAAETDTNPYKQQAEQTNVLLGLVVNLLQTISSQLESSNGQPKQGLQLPPEPQAMVSEVPMPADSAKSLTVINRYVENLSQRLSALNL